MFYNILLCFVYLRPRESLFANTLLFFGVEQETKMEKWKFAYNLKVPHIVFIYLYELNIMGRNMDDSKMGFIMIG